MTPKKCTKRCDARSCCFAHRPLFAILWRWSCCRRPCVCLSSLAINHMHERTTCLGGIFVWHKLILSVANNFFDNVLILKHYRERVACMRRLNRSYTSLLAFTNLTLGRTRGVGGGVGRGGWCQPPCKVFLSFFLEDKTSAWCFQ